jgi:choline-glycine betaine transporter
MDHPDEQTLELWLADALRLDRDEHAYLASLDLAATWRANSASPADVRWGWLALIGVVGAFLLWTLGLEPFGEILATANLVGLGTILVSTALGLLVSFSEALIDISTNPALGLSQPLLALLALGLLFWPRIQSAPRMMQGVRS